MRLVESAAYADVALSAYMKVKALASRPEGCEARTETIAGYLGLSRASVERGLSQLCRPAPDDGVVELASRRRTKPGGQGTSAVRRPRPMTRTERFVWLPVAAAEDLTPRQLRAFAVIAYAQVQHIPLTVGELAQFLRHHSGRRAGEALTVTAAGEVLDTLESARWVTVLRRAGAQGRHECLAHDVPPEARTADSGSRGETGEAGVNSAADDVSDGTSCSQPGEGSGPPAGEGSLANKESPTTALPEDERDLSSPAVGEVPVRTAVDNPADAPSSSAGDLALRADDNHRTAPSNTPRNRSSNTGHSPPGPFYDGPELTLNARIYAVLEPVHWLLQHVTRTWEQRAIAREIGRQLRCGMDDERLRLRLQRRFAHTPASDIRSPGRWLLGVALPRWSCGHLDCEEGVMWSNGAPCAVCEEIIADRQATRQRTQRLAQGLCPEHGTRPVAGECTACTPPEPGAEEAQAPREPAGPPRGSCATCACRIFLIGHAVGDGLCKGCRAEKHPVASVADPWTGPDPYAQGAALARSAMPRHRETEPIDVDAGPGLVACGGSATSDGGPVGRQRVNSREVAPNTARAVS